MYDNRANMDPDPDPNDPLLNLNIDSCFYDVDSIVKNFKMSSKPLFISLNVQSLNSKIDKLKDVILQLTSKEIVIDVIAMQETWNIKYPDLLSIPGFQKIFFCNRYKGKGGGVGFFL
jgi:hypothetical protein